jgi:23S rRNA pseudouridine1911/1915/1917 synthase
MPPEQTIQIQVEQPAARLDHFLAEAIPHLSRSQIQKLIRQGRVLLTPAAGKIGAPVSRPGSAVQPGDVIIVRLPAPPANKLQPEDIPLDVIFEDEELLVINKPAGLVIHPAHGHQSGTLVNALLARYPDLAGMADFDDDTAIDPAVSGRPGIVHRLDRDTSGLIVVARTPAALQNLQRQFKDRLVKKTYLALVFGRPAASEGVIDVPLGRDPRNRQKFAAVIRGKPARTHYRVQAGYEKYSLLEIGLETGRTHQIRVHLAWLKCPVVGDTVYGRKKNALNLERQFLHAWRLQFAHPHHDKILQLEAPLAPDLQYVLDNLDR